MVRNDREFVRFGAISYWFIALMWAGIAIVEWSFQGAFGLVATACCAEMAIGYTLQAWRWKPINDRRQMAAVYGFASRVPLAAAHPLPNVGALPLPFIITLKPNWPKFLICLVALVGTSILSDATDYQSHGLHIISLSDPFELGFFLFPVLAVGVISTLLLRSQRIAVTQEGLLVRHAAGWTTLGTDRICWSDARLFAIRGGKPGTPGTRYELSCAYAVVQWQRLRRPRWWSLYRPAIPFAEYDAQMEALIALISGVTGLPLYDVREGIPQPNQAIQWNQSKRLPQE